MKPILKISIDPGYDAFKFVIDRTLITFSSKMLDVSNEEFGVDRRADGSYYIRLEDTVNNRVVDREYLIGDATELTMHTATFLKRTAVCWNHFRHQRNSRNLYLQFCCVGP